MTTAENIAIIGRTHGSYQVTSKTPAQRVRSSEAALKSRGGRRMPGGYLQPAAASALSDLVDAGYAPSPMAVISAALLDAHKKIAR